MAKASLAQLPERRANPNRPRPGGKRVTDPTLSTADCARIINIDGIDTGFLVGEILEGRLAATIVRRPGKRNVYRIAPADLAAYQERHISKPLNAAKAPMASKV